jgi:uncharacterized membrane protein YphA (DoxX/SURF4 family)
MRKNIWIFSLLAIFLAPLRALAHENYVLPHADIERGMRDWSLHVFDAMRDPANLKLGLIIGLISILGFIAYYFFMISRWGQKLHETLLKFEPQGHLVLRLALGASFITSGLFGSFLGPEIPLTTLPLGVLLQPVLVGTGILLVLGLFTEGASLIGLIILILTTFIDHSYMLTYFNYFGELLALLFFGSKYGALDLFWQKASKFRQKYKDWEIPLIRITYGISIIYPAIMIKLMHPGIIVQIVNQYNLTQFHWLFPNNPLLIALGSGLAETAVGLCLVFGLATRLVSAVTLFLYILSISFFQEAVWPHYILVALAIYFIINEGGEWSIDSWLRKRQLKKQ